MMSMMKFLFALKDNNIRATLFPITFESLISRGRNAAIAHFLSDPEATHILFVDSDIEFEPEDVFKLLRADKEVICGGYAQKWLREDYIKKIFQREVIPQNPIELCTHVSVQVDPRDVVDHVMEITYATTGFLLIKREVFNIMRLKYPEKQYVNDIDGYMSADKDLFYDFFPATINQTSKKFESEDYGFSTLWRNCGGKVYLYTDITLKHHGWFGFPSNMYRQLVDNENIIKQEENRTK
jgi:glycosyltransferase involved in cell wall biosynthesis